MNDDSAKHSSTYVPYVPAARSLPELTAIAIGLGIALAIVFGAANAYLGLKIGMTVSASIPAAVISMAILLNGLTSLVLFALVTVILWLVSLRAKEKEEQA